MLEEYDLHTGNRGADGVIARPNEWVDSAYFPFYASAAALLIEARAQMDAATTPRTVTAAVSRILKNADSSRPDFQGIFKNGDRFIACDGYRLVRLVDDITSLPHKENAFDVACVMKGPMQNRDALELPSVADLRAFIAAAKAKKSGKNRKYACINTPYCLGGFWYCNAEYLLDVLQALPGCKAYMPDRASSPVYFTAENGDGVLLPVRPPKSKENGAGAA